MMTHHTALARNLRYVRHTLVVSLFAFGVVVSGCQPNANNNSESASNENVAVQSQAKPALTPNPEAKASIDKYQDEYVNKMLNLQQSQQAEFEALQVADSGITTPKTDGTANNNANTKNADTKNNHTNKDDDDGNVADQMAQSSNMEHTNVGSEDNNDGRQIDETLDEPSDTSKQVSSNVEESPAKEATEVSFETLPLADTPIPPPQMLSRADLVSRYTSAMQALYLPVDTPISSDDMDTLLSIATVVPELFNNDELARRLVIKSPALARLLRQYQIWEQVEVQQSAELEALSQAHLELQEQQTKEFETLMADFDKTIQGYDKKIAEYEKLLKELD